MDWIGQLDDKSLPVLGNQVVAVLILLLVTLAVLEKFLDSLSGVDSIVILELTDLSKGLLKRNVLWIEWLFVRDLSFSSSCCTSFILTGRSVVSTCSTSLLAGSVSFARSSKIRREFLNKLLTYSSALVTIDLT